jgi:hypothetical protein
LQRWDWRRKNDTGPVYGAGVEPKLTDQVKRRRIQGALSAAPDAVSSTTTKTVFP